MPLNNIWAQLDKLTEQEIKDLGINYIDEYSILPENIVTDGKGNFYEVPTSGYTKVDELENDKYFKYRYNWATNEIEVFLKNEKTDDDIQSMELIESVGVSAYDFIDNPEYWYDMIAESIEEDTGINLSDFEVEEAIESINITDNFNISDFNYEVHCRIDIETYEDTEPTFEDFNKFIEKYSAYLNDFNLDVVYYDENLNIKLQLADDEKNQVIANISYPLTLNRKNIETIFDDECKHYITNFKDNYFYIDDNIAITDIYFTD